MKEFWNERYAEPEFVYGTLPNEFFEEHLNNFYGVGKMLLPCEGEGRNAVYAASRGWKVDAFDESIKGKEKCMLLATTKNVTVDYRIDNALTFDYTAEKYDVVALIFAHFPENVRRTIHQNCLKALREDGYILLEAFHTKQIENTSGGPKDPTMLYSEEMLREDFKGKVVELIEIKTIELNEGKYHVGKADVIRLLIRNNTV